VAYVAIGGAWILLGQMQPPPQAGGTPTWVWFTMAVLGVVVFGVLNYSGSSVRSTVDEAWKKLSDDMNCNLNMGFFLSLPVITGVYRSHKVKATLSGNLLLGNLKTVFDLTMPEAVPYRLFLYGTHVHETLGAMLGMDDLSREIPDFTGQLLYKDITEQAAMSLAGPQVMQVLTAHRGGALKIEADEITFECKGAMADAAVMIEIYRWLIAMSQYVTKLR